MLALAANLVWDPSHLTPPFKGHLALQEEYLLFETSS